MFSVSPELKRMGQFIGLAVLVHLALWPFAGMWLPEVDPPKSKPQRVRMVNLGANKRQGKKHQRKKKPPKKTPEEKKLEDLQGQVVDLPPSPDNSVPKDARFLSEYNTNTKKETVSRHQQKNYRTAMNEVTRTHKSENRAPQKQNSRSLEIGPEKPNKKKQSASEEMSLQLPKQKHQQRLALELDSLGQMRNRQERQALRGNSDRLKLSMGDSQKIIKPGSAPNRGQRQLQLMPSMGVLARIAGAPSNDHIADLEEGDGTFLNSREFKYASFFNRLKRNVSQHWNPMLEYRRRDPSGNIYGHMARVTVLNVTLDADGSLKDVRVRRSSGIDFLDYEAMSAFRRAGPFPNPPKGLVGSKDSFEFPFGFHVQFMRSGGMRLPF